METIFEKFLLENSFLFAFNCIFEVFNGEETQKEAGGFFRDIFSEFT